MKPNLAKILHLLKFIRNAPAHAVVLIDQLFMLIM